MRILHLSDFHFKSGKKDIAAQDLLVDTFLKEISEKDKIDFFLFTGDIVFSGKNLHDFDSAYLSFFKRIVEKIHLPKANLLICPGNHDVNRDKINEPIKKYIRDFTKSEELTQLVEDNKADVFGLSCLPLENYRNFETQFYNKGVKNGNDVINPLYSLHIRKLDKWTIGFVSINTAWCSSGDDDKGNLFFPKTELEKAISELVMKKVDWKILLLHHPLEDLRGFNKTDIENVIYSEFDLMFSGHLHKREDFIKLTQNEGIFGSYAHAAFTSKEGGKIGYSIIDIDLDTLDITLQKHIYDHEERTFLSLTDMNFTLPCNEIKSDQIKIYKTLKKRLLEIIDKANELCVTNKEVTTEHGFRDLFVNPVLKKQPQIDASPNLNTSNRVDLKALYDQKNFLIYGKDKTGKTSLLYKLAIDLLNNFRQVSEISFYIDMNEFKLNSKKFDLQNLISKFIEHTFKQTETILRKYKFKILIDNFDPSNDELRVKLSDFFKKFTNAKYVIAADQTLAQSYERIDYGLNGYEKLFIHDISRNEIRLLTHKWPNIPDPKRDEFVDRIVDVLNQHSMPFNFWTLSIFLWIFAGRNTLNFNNNSELLELYIDDILDRNRLASDPNNRFSYANYKLLLSELANELLIKHQKSNYSMEYSKLISFVDNFKSKNKRRVGKTSEIVQHLLDRGVLKELDDDLITFRLNGVFEYFIAFNFIENKEFFRKILDDENVYLSFKNEFEIYSGFQKSASENKEFLNKVFIKTKNAFKDLSLKMDNDLDHQLILTMNNQDVIDLASPITELLSNQDLAPLSYEEKDDFLDEVNSTIRRNIDVKPKKLYDISIKNSDILEKYLMINGRVFKNIDNVNDEILVEEIFDFLINSSCNLGFLLIEEMEKDLDSMQLKEFKNPAAKTLVFHIINNYLPSVVQTFIADAIGHVNLEGIILSKIEDLKNDYHKHQFKLFILYSLLLDIDFRKYKNNIDDMIKISRMGLIKSSLLVKLCYLLLFKSYNDKNMINFLKEKIREVNLSINPKIDMKDFNKKFDKTVNLLLLKKRAD